MGEILGVGVTHYPPLGAELVLLSRGDGGVRPTAR